jgi:hypothetical protein
MDCLKSSEKGQVLPMREVVNTLLRRDLGLVDEAMGPYFRGRL